MSLALFDLDNTLLNGDSDHAWGIFLAEIGAVDPMSQQQRQDYFFQQYKDGCLDILEFCEFQFRILTEQPLEQLYEWRSEYLDTVIQPMIDTGKPHLLEPHIAKGDDVVIITATNDFLTRPIADRLGVTELLATQAELVGDQYTGRVSGVPCFQGGKVTRLESWMSANNKAISNSVFYSDSINDLPLLHYVDTAIAVTPDQQLRAEAERLHWQIID